MAGQYQALLESAVERPRAQIADLPILSNSERQRLLAEFNDTASDFPRGRCAHELIEEQTERHPDRVAVSWDAEELTYGELEVRANQFVPQGRVEVDLPSAIDDVVISLSVCKNLLSIGSEALHNAVRHGKADRLRIRLQRAPRRAFELLIEDNGVGFDTSSSSDDGLGLTSMRTRMEELGGSLTIDSMPGRGTTVTVRFATWEYRT